MGQRGGQPGNRNAQKGRIWSEAVIQAGKRADAGITQGDRLVDIAALALWDKAISGDVPALRELGDRLDGKAAQPVELNADVEVNSIVRTIVDPVEKLEEFLVARGA
jgi:hypothetical protein